MREAPRPADILINQIVRVAFAQAWSDSKPASTATHEEGGFVVLEKDGNLKIERWPRGEGSLIQVPPHDGCAFNGSPIIASFHTHPNADPDYLQEPSETDKNGVRDDKHLKGRLYIGEFVIANEMVYLITRSGAVRELADRIELLGSATEKI